MVGTLWLVGIWVQSSHKFWTLQIVDPSEIEKMVDKVLSENPKQLEQYRGGKTKLQGFFAGQVWQVLQFWYWPFY